MAQEDELTTRSWEMLPGESLRAYQAFATYLDLPEETRRYATVADVTNIDLKAIRGWAKTYDWAGRLESWTQHVGRGSASGHAQKRVEHIE